MISTILDSLRTLTSLAAVGMVLYGWQIVNNQNNQREARKELKSMLDSLVAELEIVTRDAVSFHTEKYNCYQGITIQSAVSRTVKQASRIGHILEIDLRQDCIDFRQSITRNNFDRTAHKPLDMDNPMILEIIDLSFVLRDRLETAFQDKYTFS